MPLTGDDAQNDGRRKVVLCRKLARHCEAKVKRAGASPTRELNSVGTWRGRNGRRLFERQDIHILFRFLLCWTDVLSDDVAGDMFYQVRFKPPASLPIALVATRGESLSEVSPGTLMELESLLLSSDRNIILQSTSSVPLHTVRYILILVAIPDNREHQDS